MRSDCISVDITRDWQGIFIAYGDGVVTRAADERPVARPDLSPIQRAVLVARLRAHADVIERGGLVNR